MKYDYKTRYIINTQQVQSRFITNKCYVLSTKKQPLVFKNFEVLANAEGNVKAKSK